MASSVPVVNCVVFVILYLLSCTCGETTVEIFVENGDVDNLEEGGNVTMRCEARDMGAASHVVWQHGTVNLAPSDRVTIITEELGGRGDSSQDKACTLVISPVMERDRGLYRCRIVENNLELGERVIETAEITLTVFSFPNETSPQCSPSGPTALHSGDVLSLTCSTYPGYPAVNVTITSSDVTFRDMQWRMETRNEEIVRKLNWEASLAQDGAVITCSITSTHFPSSNKDCVIGPITVKKRPVSTASPVTQSPTTRPSTLMPVAPDESSTSRPTMLPISEGFPWLYAFLIGVILFTLSLAINIIMCAVVVKVKRARDIYKVKEAQQAFIEKQKQKQKSKNGKLRLNGIDNTQFNPEPIAAVSSTSPV